MMRLTLGIVALFCLSFSKLWAQTDTTKLHEAKMNMIREAVNFYSQDSKLSKKPINCKATEILGLKECAKDMNKVSVKIDKWNKVAVTDEAALKGLGKTIIEDVTVGADKEHRQRISGYKDFESQINAYGDTKAEQGATIVEGGQPSTAPSTPDNNTPEPTEPSVQTPATTVSSSVTELIWKDPFILSCVAILIALAAFIIALMAKNRKSNRRSGSGREMQADFSESGADAYQTQTNISALQRQVANLERELGAINSMIVDTERRLNEKVRTLDSQHMNELPRQDHASATATHTFISKKWAKNVDGGGFEMDSLSSDPDSKMIYEITQTGAQTAIFKVSETREAQIFALTNPQNYLREGCNYTSQPSSNSQIRTEVPGTLELQGRKWRIIDQAQIAFS